MAELLINGQHGLIFASSRLSRHAELQSYNLPIRPRRTAHGRTSEHAIAARS
jgi:hypothetical protein